MSDEPVEAVSHPMSQVRQRADSAGLPCEDVSVLKDGSVLRVVLPTSGGEPREILVNASVAGVYLSADFEYWTFVGDYFGVDNSKQAETELVLSPVTIRDLRRLIQLAGVEQRAGARVKLDFTPDMSIDFKPRSGSNVRVRIGSTSVAVRAAGISTNGRYIGTPSLYISGLSSKLRRRERLLDSIQQVADAVLFELWAVHGIAADLTPVPRHVVLAAMADRAEVLPTVPGLKYSAEAMSLFRYAQSSEKLPLLRFLAFYQVVEYFFPSYAERDTLRRLRQIVIDPTFSADRDSDVARLSQAIRNKMYLTERDQLKSTIRHCVNDGDLKEFIEADPERVAFVSNRKNGLKAAKPLALKDAGSPLGDQVAERIYDIRCRIVHAKDGGGPTQAALLLPFSAEARSLGHDIEVMRFIAQKVLISSARQTSWEP
ncbi:MULTISPECIES: hypothetical protein [unclassified Micromonospora]|uniref:hypothetical protein n=1 Tax=unclassified Micromonospora TaxID=2617518 RepID=UPI001126754C|nr:MULTISPECIES: hypothetical protein [unclassified Micromonospora]MCK1807230.1 hypothetical protein [Micromonospora sp. R42106]MCK1831220.1 hypothetical protein [Micromonospora sp. R42003]MCK1842811.1 hypothetical protein [Micromonospora sp. R42004]MCM1018998.1 hypothetical protein [Micromonospora sp. XM-20-01]